LFSLNNLRQTKNCDERERNKEEWKDENEWGKKDKMMTNEEKIGMIK
jgi:hypothetical protein